MPNFTKFNEKDIDGRWFQFDHQHLGNSCTLASCKIAKEFFHNRPTGEEYLRGLSTLIKKGKTNQEISPLAANVTQAHNWDIAGAGVNQTVGVMRAQPLPVPSAHSVTPTVDVLRSATRNRPVLAGWRWLTTGGHFTVCVGPTKSDRDLFVILDPWFGLQYVNADEAVRGTLFYRPIDPATGKAGTKAKFAAAITTG